MGATATLALVVAMFAPPAQERSNYPTTWVNGALADAKKGVPTTTRYIVARTQEERAAIAFVVNSVVSRSPVTIRPRAVDDSLVAIDLAFLSTNETELQTIVSLWTSLANDEYYFHEHSVKLVDVAPFTHTDGKRYTKRNLAFSVSATRLGAPLVELQTLLGNLTPETASVVPVVRGDWLVSRLTQVVNNGRYYDFRGLKIGETTLDSYLESRGASRKLAEKLRADERSGLLSQVTAKPRAVQLFQTSGTRPSAGPGYAAITEDVDDENFDVRADAFRQLVELRPDGREVMVTLANGWIEWTLFDAQGKLVKFAPEGLVSDHEIPRPFTRRLNGIISCVRCHASHDGWKPIPNEVAASSKGFIGEPALLSRLAGLYGADEAHFASALEGARESYAKNIDLACRTTAKEAMLSVAAVFNRYEYEFVSEKTAINELGFPETTVNIRAVVPVAVPSDPIINRLYTERVDLESKKRVGLLVTRRQFERVYDQLARLAK